MTEYKPTEYVVDFGDCRSNQFVRLSMVQIEQNGARLHERIVRCRDCEFGAYDGNECMRIDEWDGSLWFPVEPGGFCKWGVPRDAPDPTCDECGMKCIEKYEAGCPREERQ